MSNQIILGWFLLYDTQTPPLPSKSTTLVFLSILIEKNQLNTMQQSDFEYLYQFLIYKGLKLEFLSIFKGKKKSFFEKKNFLTKIFFSTKFFFWTNQMILRTKKKFLSKKFFLVKKNFSKIFFENFFSRKWPILVSNIIVFDILRRLC